MDTNPINKRKIDESESNEDFKNSLSLIVGQLHQQQVNITKKNKKKSKKKKNQSKIKLDIITSKSDSLSKNEPSSNKKARTEQKRDHAISKKIKSHHPFDSEYGDHFETPRVAYEHLQPVLTLLAKILDKTPESLRIYDPFYCEGAMVKHMSSLGFNTIIHENVDFWKSVKQGQVPDYDILVTNPPFSGDHKERIIKFCVESNKPWSLLLPNYVATKSYYINIISSLRNTAPFYIVPTITDMKVIDKYHFFHPEGTGHDLSPFDSFWFVDIHHHQQHLNLNNKESFNHIKSLKHHFQIRGRSKNNEKSISSAVIVESIDELKSLKYVPTIKRLNPKQRRKAAAKKLSGTSSF